MNRTYLLALTPIALTLVAACSSPEQALPDPLLVEVPPSREDGRGSFVSPYMDSGALAPWATRAIDAGALTDVAGSVGIDKKNIVESSVSLIGSAFSSDDEDRGPNENTLEAAGGWETIRGTSDVTFDAPDALAAHLYGRHASDRSFAAALKLTFDLYPDVRDGFFDAVRASATAAPGQVDEAGRSNRAMLESDIRAAIDGLGDRYEAEIDAINEKLEKEYDRANEDAGGVLGPRE